MSGSSKEEHTAGASHPAKACGASESRGLGCEDSDVPKEQNFLAPHQGLRTRMARAAAAPGRELRAGRRTDGAGPGENLNARLKTLTRSGTTGRALWNGRCVVT